MKLTLKHYKLGKVKLLIKEKNLLIFCNFVNEVTKSFVKLKEHTLKRKVKFFKINSSLIRYLIKNSIYSNLKNLNFGSIVILHFNVLKFFTEVISNLNVNNNQLYFFCCIFNKKFYQLKLFLGLKTLKFISNIKLLHFYLKKYIKIKFLSFFFLLNKKLFRNNVI